MRAEGVACGYQYIGKPIFLYEALRRKRIYGTSEYPYSLQDASSAVRYEEGECPTCEAVLDEMLTVPLHRELGGGGAAGHRGPALRESPAPTQAGW